MNIQPYQKNRFLALDGWRGVCACLVALLHFSAYSHIYPVPIIRSAGFFVDFFFVLSGFVIFNNYEEKLIKGYSLFNFLFLRFGRLYPLHLVTLSAYIIIEVAQLILPSLQFFSNNPPFTNSGESIPDLISHLFLFQALDLEHAKGFNAPSWSISAEFYTYIVFGIAIIALKKYIHVFNILACLFFGIFLMYIFGLEKGEPLKAYEGFFRCLSCFGAGGICWLIWKHYANYISHLFHHKLFWSVLEILSLIAIYQYIVHTKGTSLQYLTPIVFSLILLLYSCEKGVISDSLKNKFFQFLGLLSYSIYMVHTLVGGKVFPAIVKISEKYLGHSFITKKDNIEMYGLTLWQGDMIYLLYLAIVIGVSYISYKIVEEPIRNLSRKIIGYKAKI